MRKQLDKLSELRNTMPETTVRILYKNYKGEIGVRRIIPRKIVFASNEWHPVPQWLLEAHDLDKGVERTFALCDVRAWF